MSQDNFEILANLRQTNNSPEEVGTHKKCPFCFEEILADAIKCKHCGEFLDTTFKRELKNKKTQYSRVFPLWKFFLFELITLGWFKIYWSYIQWTNFKKLIDAEKKTEGHTEEFQSEKYEIKPLLETFLMSVPIVYWWKVVKLYDIFKLFSKLYNVPMVKNTGFKLFLLLSLEGLGSTLSWQSWRNENHILNQLFTEVHKAQLLEILWILLIFTLFPIQKSLNTLWQKVDSDLPVRNTLSVKEIIFVSIFGLFYLVELIYTFYPNVNN